MERFRKKLAGKRVTLVPVTKSDHFENAQRWLSDPDVTQYLGDATLFELLRSPYAFDELERDAEGTHFAIRDEKDEHIGFVGMEYLETRHRVASGYVLIGEKTRWGNGYATEAARLAIAYAFEEIGIHRLEIAISIENNAALRVLLESGFRHEGIRRQCVFSNGQWHDMAVAAMLGEDYAELAKRRWARRPL